MITLTVPLEVRGRYLWKGDKRFLVRGVVYQSYDDNDFSLAGRDLLKDESLPQLQHDVGLLKELGVNTIYVYAIDHTKCHTRAMKMLEDAGIHVLFTLPHVKHCILRVNPQASYTPNTLDAFFRKVDEMASFPNTLGFLVADSLINDTFSEICAPVITAVVRDLKKYMNLKHQATGQRILPVGFGEGQYDGDVKVLNYLAAGDESSRIDFWACKGYTWVENCGTDASDCGDLVAKYNNTSIPIFFSEYGDNSKPPRDFRETTALFSPQMTAVFSGGCVYELWRGSNEYGLAGIGRRDAGFISGTPALRREQDEISETRQLDSKTLYIFKDFTNYQRRLADSSDVIASTDDATAPTQGVKNWKDQLFGHKPSEGVVPSSCVDWARVERDVNFARPFN